MKRVFSILAATVCMATMMSVTAYAHGGHGGQRAGGQSRHELCTVAGCGEIGSHQHDGSWYCGRSGDAGDYAACTVDGCGELGLHEHNGEYYYCGSHGTGLGCGRGRSR